MKPEVWGPPWWNVIRISCETWRPSSPTDDSLERFVEIVADVLPCKNPCAIHYRAILNKYPPSEWLSASTTRQRKMQWYALVRQAVRLQEPKMSVQRWLQRNSVPIMQTVGFVLLVLLAGCVGALICKRCAEKSSAAKP